MKRLGIDVGSTTLKCVVMDEENELLFTEYMRHFSRIGEKLGGLLSVIGEKFPGEDMELARKTEGIYLKYPFYGGRRIAREISAEGRPVNRKRVQRLMRLMELVGQAPGPRQASRIRSTRPTPTF